VGWPIDRSSSVIKKKSILKFIDRTVYSYQRICTAYYRASRNKQTPFTGDDKSM